jgi:hypothetical protein
VPAYGKRQVSNFMMSAKFWQDLKGYEGSYQIRIINNEPYIEVRSIKYGKPHRPLKFKICSNGYYTSKLFGRISKTAHRLIAIQYIPNPYNKKQVNHINGIKTDNRIKNLEWVTAKENTLHAIKAGLMKRSPRGKTRVHVYKDGVYIKTIEGVRATKDSGFCSACVSDCINGKQKKHKGHTFVKA